MPRQKGREERKISFGVTLSPDLVKKIDEVRGLAKRSTFIDYKLKEAFKWAQTRGDLLKRCDDLLEMIKVRLELRGVPVFARHKLLTAQYVNTLRDIRQKVLDMKAELLKE